MEFWERTPAARQAPTHCTIGPATQSTLPNVNCLFQNQLFKTLVNLLNILIPYNYKNISNLYRIILNLFFLPPQ